MRILIHISIGILFTCTSFAQKSDYTWLLGYKPINPQPDSTLGINLIEFSKGFNKSGYLPGEGNMLFTNASISDPQTGDLIAYSDGCRVFNRQFEMMENGNYINYGKDWINRCEKNLAIYYPITNSSLLLPRPGNNDQLILLHAKDTITSSGFWIEKLFYSVLDFSDNPDGKIISKNNVIYHGQINLCELHAVKHTNGTDWWVMMVGYKNNTYLRFLVQKDTVYLHGTQDIGPVDYPGGGSNLKFSPDGKKLARFSRDEGAVLFDFDRSTGQLSNFRQWLIPDSTFTYYSSGEFSPNSRYIYINNTFTLWQLDTEEADLASSGIKVAEYDGFIYNGLFATGFQYMNVGPDCKIYMSTDGATPFLHVIHHPDLPGSACGFEQRAIKLKATNGKCLPNMVNYRLDTGPVCDSTLSTSFFLPVQAEVRLLEVRPNPARGQFQVMLPDFGLSSTLSVIDISGREVARLPWTGETMNVICAGWTPGLYFLNLYDPQGRYASGKVMVE